MLGRLEDELKAIAEPVEGVKSVETKVGKDFYKPDIYRKMDFEKPSRVLLVDDEHEFVQTLSERLEMRDVGSAIAYDGESALRMVEDDEPEVIILDLRMPGIDGIEVLRRVKKTHPSIEVIILTGHGSDEDRKTCMELGAFAYLQKPVDIEELSETLKRANEKARRAGAGEKSSSGRTQVKPTKPDGSSASFGFAASVLGAIEGQPLVREALAQPSSAVEDHDSHHDGRLARPAGGDDGGRLQGDAEIGRVGIDPENLPDRLQHEAGSRVFPSRAVGRPRLHRPGQQISNPHRLRPTRGDPRAPPAELRWIRRSRRHRFLGSATVLRRALRPLEASTTATRSGFAASATRACTSARCFPVSGRFRTW